MHNLMPGNYVYLDGKIGKVFERGAMDKTYYVKVRWQPTGTIQTFINKDISKLKRVDK